MIRSGRSIYMSGFVFEENLSREEFGSLRGKEGVKTHFLGSYAWGEVSGSGNWTPYYTGVRKDGEIVATALILQKKLIAGYSYCYIPRGFTMDWSDTELLRYMTSAVRDFCRRHKAIFFKIDPDIRYHMIDENGMPVAGENNESLVQELKNEGYDHLPLTYFFDSEQPRFTFRIRTDRDIKDIRAGYDKIVKRRLRQAASDRVEIVEGTREDIGEFVRLMIHGGCCEGAVIHDTFGGKSLALCGAVILCCGGMNGLFPGMTTGTTQNSGSVHARRRHAPR